MLMTHGFGEAANKLTGAPDPLHPAFWTHFAAYSGTLTNLSELAVASPKRRQLAEAANEPCSCLRQQVARRPTQSTNSPPGFGSLQPGLGLGVLSVGPGERRNPHELVTREMEQAFDQHELEQL